VRLRNDMSLLLGVMTERVCECLAEDVVPFGGLLVVGLLDRLTDPE
jgi:hypothetical protein